MKNEKNPEASLQFENDLLKLKLNAEFGMDFSNEKAGDLDPLLENEWLNQVYEIENLHNNSKTMPLFEFIGSPAFKSAEECDDNSIKKELKKLIELLNENNLNLSCVCDYDDRTIYKFITEEFFNIEIEDVRLKGWVTEFIYEEFHPNHDYDLRRQAGEFMHALFKRKWDDFDEIMLCELLTNDHGEEISRDKFIDQINIFQHRWNEFRHVEYQMNHSCFDLKTETGNVNLKLTYIAYAEPNKSIFVTGVVSIGFKLIFDYWNIYNVSIPGFSN